MRACRDCQFFSRQGEFYGQCQRLAVMRDDAGGYFLDSISMFMLLVERFGAGREDTREPKMIVVPEFFLCVYFTEVEHEVLGQRDAVKIFGSDPSRAIGKVFRDFGWPTGEERLEARRNDEEDEDVRS